MNSLLGWVVGLLAVMAIVACASGPTAAPTPIATVTTVCLPLKTYTAVQQATVAAELAKLPPTDPLAAMVVDYGAMRDADRACMGAK